MMMRQSLGSGSREAENDDLEPVEEFSEGDVADRDVDTIPQTPLPLRESIKQAESVMARKGNELVNLFSDEERSSNRRHRNQLTALIRKRTEQRKGLTSPSLRVADLY